jgi:hypothetical protein
MNSASRTTTMQAITLVLGLLFVVLAHADFKRSYGSGVRDYTKGDYSDAIESLQKAIDEESTAQEKVRIYGMRYEPYINQPRGDSRPGTVFRDAGQYGDLRFSEG